MIKRETDFVSHGLNDHRFQRIQDTFLVWRMMRKNLHSLDLAALYPGVRDVDDVAKLVQQLNKYDIFRVHAALQDSAFAEDDGVAINIPLVPLATKDIAPSDVVNDLLTAEGRGKQHLVSNVQKRLIDGSVLFHDSTRKHFSKTFGDLYNKQYQPSNMKWNLWRQTESWFSGCSMLLLLAGQLKWIQPWNMSFLQFRSLKLMLEVICIQPLKQNSLTS